MAETKFGFAAREGRAAVAKGSSLSPSTMAETRSNFAVRGGTKLSLAVDDGRDEIRLRHKGTSNGSKAKLSLVVDDGRDEVQLRRKGGTSSNSKGKQIERNIDIGSGKEGGPFMSGKI
ncbi:hypothetical protein TIFTF001_032167 [Ficus carica]|uniref:Uncharacterized protein n=1 Tax=Ficus carica TaxID=3494 RepID=A0AA88DWN1_FICCA|nr:hypothetical protein TIFTF001_032167 [Ficus carica]